MDMKLIKKSQNLTLRQMKEIEAAEDELLQAESAESVDFSPTVVEELPIIISDSREPDYIPFIDNPQVHSVGNSGWQISDIWRDIRVDDFCG